MAIKKQRSAARRTGKSSGNAAAEVDYKALAQFRFELRKFLAFSEAAARRQKLTPQHHQALLAIKGFSGDGAATIGNLAARLLVRHHTAVELVDRMARLGLVVRVADPTDGRRSLIKLTSDGERRLRKLSQLHLRELKAVSGPLTRMLASFRRIERA